MKSATIPTFTLYAKYIEPIADTFAYVLLCNHFHLLVRIKDLPGLRELAGLVGDDD